MTPGTVVPRRLLVGAMAIALTTGLILPAATSASSHDPDLLATLELPGGDIDYDLELGTLHFFDEENAPFGIQILDGCTINDRLWPFGIGLLGIPAPVTVMDLDSGKDARILLPAHERGGPVETVLEPDGLELCGDTQLGGLPELDGRATLTSATARGDDYTAGIALLSDGRDDAYRRLVRDGISHTIISKGSPVVAIDDSGSFEELTLLAEGRTPRQVEGVVFGGSQGMLPARARLDKALRSITNARVRRAFEAAKNGQVPRALIEDLGLGRVDDVHHISLELDTLGADAWLAQAGWIRDGGQPIEPPSTVHERFTVELLRADGASEPLPLVGPLVGSEAEGRLWEYRSHQALVQIIDGCALSSSFWTVAGAALDEPVELLITDTRTGTSASHLLWTDREEVSRLTDTLSLETCP